MSVFVAGSALGCAKKAEMRATTGNGDTSGANAASGENAGSQPPPSYVVPGAQDYQGDNFDPRVALDDREMGTWVEIPARSGRWYFVPNQELRDDNWAPYRHGYWSYDTDYDWTWVSYDPWGWVTDHYGIWRHHGYYGWIWYPFEDRAYQPHAVTWFDRGDDDDYIGWYPYHPAYRQHYYRGDGFDDGLWDGPDAVMNFSFGMQTGPASGFFLGITVVNRAHVTDPDIYALPEVLRPNFNVVRVVVKESHHHNHRRVFRYPGGKRGHSYDYLQKRARNQAPVGNARRIRTKGGAQIMVPDQRNSIPDRERKRWKGWDRGGAKDRGFKNDRGSSGDDMNGRADERDARKAAERAEREARQQREQAEREARKEKEQAERDARKQSEQVEREARKQREQAEREARQQREQSEHDARETQRRANREAKERADRQAREQAERDAKNRDALDDIHAPKKRKGNDIDQAPPQMEEDRGIGKNKKKRQQSEDGASIEERAQQANEKQKEEARKKKKNKKTSDESGLPPSAPEEDSSTKSKRKKFSLFG